MIVLYFQLYFSFALIVITLYVLQDEENGNRGGEFKLLACFYDGSLNYVRFVPVRLY